ncbi:MAG: phosphoribosylaminoimidazolesuccinocarboxamide synthase [Anaerolineaceae bacterium]|nr:phosphoribosylaminoimidazolesuccinocarboxamide synthase [Anaerolineaceae bacterium]
MVSSEIIRNVLSTAFHSAELPLGNKISGKVRDWYDLNDKERLIVTTDRLSAFDKVLAKIPFKGQVLNQLSAWWFAETEHIVQNHMLSTPDPNAMIVKQATPFPIEVIVRGYITGVTSTALWKRYSLGEREIYGYTFPDGLQKNQKLEKAIVTPTTKDGPTGHDERLTCAEVIDNGLLPEDIWQETMHTALELFEFGQQKARQAGFILVDTKYEFGYDENGKLILIDEIHTPDSSRFWKADTYQQRLLEGKEPDGFDKESIRMAYIGKGYQGEGSIPELDDDLFIKSSQNYIHSYEMLSGRTFILGEYPVNDRLIHNLQLCGVLS